MQEYEVRDMALAPSGHEKINWVKKINLLKVVL